MVNTNVIATRLPRFKFWVFLCFTESYDLILVKFSSSVKGEYYQVLTHALVNTKEFTIDRALITMTK